MEKEKVKKAYENAKDKKINELILKLRASELYDVSKDINSLYKLVNYCWRLGFIDGVNKSPELFESLYNDIMREEVADGRK